MVTCWDFSFCRTHAFMENISCSERWFPSSKLKSRETMIAVACVAFIALSYFALVSTPTGFYGSLVPPKIRRFFGMDDDEANPKQYQRTMEEVFGKAAMPNRTVIITTLNAAWAANNSMMDMFLESFHHGDGTERLLQHLIIVCVDQRAYDRCLAIHPHCFKIKTGGVNFSGEQLLLSEDYIKMMWRRIKFLKTVLEMDYSFIFTVYWNNVIGAHLFFVKGRFYAKVEEYCYKLLSRKPTTLTYSHLVRCIKIPMTLVENGRGLLIISPKVFESVHNSMPWEL